MTTNFSHSHIKVAEGSIQMFAIYVMFSQNRLLTPMIGKSHWQEVYLMQLLIQLNPNPYKLDL